MTTSPLPANQLESHSRVWPVKTSRRIFGNTLWNLSGSLIPLFVGVVTLPFLIRGLGFDRYGFLTLVWVLIGYAGIFDLGIGRAVTRLASRRLAFGDVAGAHRAANTGSVYLMALGVAIALALGSAAAWLVENAIRLPPEMNAEGATALRILCMSIPLVMLTSAYVGVLTAHDRFRELNLLRTFLGIGTLAGPLLVIQFSTRLEAVVAFVAGMRAVGTLAHALLCSRRCGFKIQLASPDATTGRELLTIGGWITVSNIVGPMMTYLDRFVVSALLPIRMVAFYATPYDLVTRMSIFPGALMSALYPRAAGLDPRSADTQRMMVTATKVLFVLTFPLFFAVIVLAEPGLKLWLGADFAAYGAPVLQLLAVGMAFNALAQPPAMIIQASGNPRWLAQLHFIELPLFGVALWFLTMKFGLIGAALAATLRYVADTVAVVLMVWRGVFSNAIHLRATLVPLVLAACLCAGSLLVTDNLHRLAYLLVSLAAFATYAWNGLLVGSERSIIKSLLAKRGPP